MPLSVNHVILFCEPDDTIVFECELLGDSDMILDGEKYYCWATIECLRELMRTEFKAVTADSLKGLSEVQYYVNRTGAPGGGAN